MHGELPKMSAKERWVVGVALVAVPILSVVIYRRAGPARTSPADVVGRSGGVAPIPIGAFPSNPPDARSQGEPGSPAGADDVHLSPSGSIAPSITAAAETTDQAPEGVSYDAVAASGVFTWYDETPLESVLATTLAIWSDEGFQEFVGDRVASYPTEEDARFALESPLVQEALFAFIVADGVAVEFELSPDAPRDLLENARRAYDTAEVGLWRALDKGSSFKDWERLGNLWREFDAD